MPIITLTGASGVGKTSYAHELLKLPDWLLIPSTTTRASRAKDLPGEYRHVTDDDFAARTFLWDVRLHGHRYGTDQADVESALDDRHYRMMLVDPQGVRLLRRHIGGRGRTANVYLLSPAEAVLRERLERRKTRDGLSDNEVERRVVECRDWDEAALASDLPYLFVPGEVLIADAASFIRKLVDRALKGEAP